MTRILGTSLLLTMATVGLANGQTASPASPLEGIWGAARHFGPTVRGTLEITRAAGEWRAQVAQFDQSAFVEGDRVSFALPDGQGSFAGRLGEDEVIRGHWKQGGAGIGGGWASPVTLRPEGPGRWRGEIVPLDKEFTIYLVVSRQADGSLGAYLRSPDNNQGFFWRLERVEQDGNRVKLVGRFLGRGDEQVFGEGEYHPDKERLSVYFGARGDTFDLVRIDDDATPGFFPRGKNPPPYEYRAPAPAQDGWRVGTLQEVGMTIGPIAELVGILSATPTSLRDPDIHGLLIARHGKLVVEEYFHGFHRAKPHDTRSAAKVLATTMVGAAILARTGLELTTPVYDLLYHGQPPPGMDARKKAMTVEHLLTMSSGYDCDDWDGSRPGSEDVMWQQSDFYQFTLELPMEMEPGKQAVYCSVNANLLGKVVSEAAQQPLIELFAERVARPLEIERYWLGPQPTGEPYLGGGARFLPRDFMKLGQMMLDGGVWNGKRILDADYANRASTPLVALRGEEVMKFGFLWWTIAYPYKGRTLHAYFASGNGGQEVVVIPELDMVVATYGGSYNDAGGWIMVKEHIPNLVLAAVADESPRPPATWRQRRPQGRRRTRARRPSRGSGGVVE